MELLNIASTQPGHVIARAVTDPEGIVLCPPGFRLTERAIDRLKRVGVESVTVNRSDRTRNRLEKRLSELEARFTTVEDPLMLRIKGVIESRLQFMLLELDGEC